MRNGEGAEIWDISSSSLTRKVLLLELWKQKSLGNAGSQAAGQRLSAPAGWQVRGEGARECVSVVGRLASKILVLEDKLLASFCY